MNHVDKSHTSNGFTLIELMLSMSFIAVLLIAIAMTIVQISGIYNHGLTLKDVNQAGSTLTTQLQNSINQSSPFPIDSGSTTDFIQQGNAGNYWGGRLCVGQYSYVWNYGKALTTNSPSNLNTYSNSSKPINFVKVLDPGATYCMKNASGGYPSIDATNAVDLINSGDHNLAIHAFSISSPATAIDALTNQRLYTIDFTIGTNNQSALTYNASDMPACKVPGLAGSDALYCSISSFEIVARAGNAVQ